MLKIFCDVTPTSTVDHQVAEKFLEKFWDPPEKRGGGRMKTVFLEGGFEVPPPGGGGDPPLRGGCLETPSGTPPGRGGSGVVRKSNFFEKKSKFFNFFQFFEFFRKISKNAQLLLSTFFGQFDNCFPVVLPLLARFFDDFSWFFEFFRKSSKSRKIVENSIFLVKKSEFWEKRCGNDWVPFFSIDSTPFFVQFSKPWHFVPKISGTCAHHSPFFPQSCDFNQSLIRRQNIRFGGENEFFKDFEVFRKIVENRKKFDFFSKKSS